MNFLRKSVTHRRLTSLRFLSKDVEKNDGAKSDECRQITVGIVGGGMTPVYTAVLLKQLKCIRAINIVDTSDSLAAAVFDASHIDTKTKIKYYRKTSLKEGLKNVNVVALMDDADSKILSREPKIQLMMSSRYVREVAEKICKINSSAIVAVFARPVTATLPLVSEIFRRAGRWNPNKILGSVALDVMRIESMAANLFHLNPAFLSVPVVGGADPSTVVPLLSRAKPLNYISTEHEKLLISQLRCCDTELEDCGPGDFRGPAMSSGAAAAKFLSTIARALAGERHVTCSAYVRSNIMPFCRFFANEVELGPEGVRTNCGLPKVSPVAVDLIQRTIPVITELSDVACRSLEDDERLAASKKT